jgi:dipeptidyl aminopeptidase/acylaminoacyl peptidase
MKHITKISASILLCCFSIFIAMHSALAQPQNQPISLEQAMANPDWLGRQPLQPYWADDSESVYFRRKREGVEQTDLFQIAIDGNTESQISPLQFDRIDTAEGTLSSNGRLKTYAREGDIYIKNLRSEDISQLTRTSLTESNPSFSADDAKIIFSRDDQWFVRNLDSGLEAQAADIRFENQPSKEDRNYLEEQQLRLFDIVQLNKEREELEEEFNEEIQASDSSRISLPYYLGEDNELLQSALSPNEQWLLVSLQDKTEQDLGREGSMPNYVTSSGYVENREVRVRVGTTDFANQQLYLIDLQNHQVANLDLNQLPSIQSNPLSDQLGNDYPDTDDGQNNRELRFTNLEWSQDGNKVLFQAVSRDNKDRWLLTLKTEDLTFAEPAITSEEDDSTVSNSDISDLMTAIELDSDHLQVVHHNHDPAWINRQFINAAWLPDNQSLFFLSEQDGYGHLYLFDGEKEDSQQLTQGKFEIREPTLTRDGEQIYFRSNIDHPTIYNIYRLNIDNKGIEQMSSLGGMSQYQLSPDESRLLIVHSKATQPDELFISRTRSNSEATRITHTISDEFNNIAWVEPEFVEVPSSNTQDPIHSRVYTPENNLENRPAVIFIHGAGYLQNSHQGWSGYFREFMFHSFLVQQGYVVLDMDYRASSGYGRDWRTAIYQQMGTPEVQDLADGIDWLADNKNVDRSKVCTYGGSYGGFLTLMALFNEPDMFACGAALRPVTDWAAYNHGYTSNILNIPDLDPAAYERSSPIEFAEGLSKPLLIAHGMQDNNVFFQDSVRLAQRLIELKKENWELAVYPIEAHGFREPSSWLDEYRRIYKLVEDTLGQ